MLNEVCQLILVNKNLRIILKMLNFSIFDRVNFIFTMQYIILILMNQSQSQAIQENQFYEHLTELIRIFKRIVFVIEDITSIMKADGQYEMKIDYMKKIMAQEQAITQRFNFSLEPHKAYHSAYHRFICRLVQNLAPCKNKISKDENKIVIIQQFLAKLENCINFHRKQRNLARIFSRIYVYIQKFCVGCEMLLSCYSQDQALQPLRKQIEEQKQRGDEQKIIPKAAPQTQTNFHRIMTIFNKRFATISCLDLDYNSYKSYCFLSRSDTDDELFKDLINRNAIVCKAITKYSHNFTQFTKKKQKTIMRKNRFRQLKQNIKTNQYPNQPQKFYSRHQIESFQKDQLQTEQKSQDYQMICLPILKQQQKRIIFQNNLQKDQSRKQQNMKARRGNYEMKNVYLTINKFHDKFQSLNSNRFLLNYSITKAHDPQRKNASTKKYDLSLKSTQIINQSIAPSLFMQAQKKEVVESLAFQQMILQSKMALSPRVSIIHRCHADKKNQKRNIRITNLTFRGPNYSKLSSLLDPEKITIS